MKNLRRMRRFFGRSLLAVRNSRNTQIRLAYRAFPLTRRSLADAGSGVQEHRCGVDQDRSVRAGETACLLNCPDRLPVRAACRRSGYGPP